MVLREYAIKQDGVFLHEEGPRWGTRRVALFDRDAAIEYIRGCDMTDYGPDKKPEVELYEREVEIHVKPWRKARRK